MNEIKKEKQDSAKINLLHDYFRQYKSTDPDLAKAIICEAIKIGEKNNLYKQLTALYNDLGTFYDINGMADSSLYFLNKTIQLATQQNNQEKIGLAYKNIGILYYDVANYKESLKNLITSVKINEKINNMQGIADAKIWIGVVHEYGLKKYRIALNYYFDALSSYKKLNAEDRISYCYNNLGNTYNKMQLPDSALYFMNLSLQIKIKNKDTLAIGSAYNNIGTVLYDIKQYDKSLEYYFNSLQLREKMNDLNGIASCYINIGNVYIQKNELSKAEEYHKKAYHLSRKIVYNDGVLAALEGLAETYGKQNNYNAAFQTQKEYGNLKDSIFDLTSSEQMAEMQTKYETEKKENEIKQQQLKIRQRNTLLIALFIIFLLSIFAFYMIYNRYKLKQQTKLQQELFNEQQKRSEAILEAEEIERQRIARDLHDGVGQLLSATKLNFNAITNNLSLENKQTEEKLYKSISMIDDSIKEIRNISHNMMPATLQHYGIIKAIEEFTDRMNQSGKSNITFEHHDVNESQLNNTFQLMLYRITQEIINNTLKYAEAQSVNIQLIGDENELILTIEDNGIGFDVQKAMEKDGIGLKNIQLRVEYLKGNLNIDSTIGKGTTTIIEIPLS
ncbi:MAG: sensor histidine kinase [Chitinophagales bacterium]